MDTLKFEQLSEKEMKQVLGGQWVKSDGQWYWLSGYSLGEGEDDQ